MDRGSKRMEKRREGHALGGREEEWGDIMMEVKMERGEKKEKRRKEQKDMRWDEEEKGWMVLCNGRGGLRWKGKH